jgi:hypothetical protein
MFADRGSPFCTPGFEHPLAQGFERGGVDRVTTAARTLDNVPRGGCIAG